ncbi:DNA topoisomerase type II [Aureococcus anophagefferens]|nr:DNA topoisomerase type II [Aureococcus anophagefferens]
MKSNFALKHDFTFDVRRYPLADALRAARVPDLAHDRRSEGWKRRLAPLLDAARRRHFLDLYDDFVRRVALPAVAPAERSEVRYQACPCVRVHCPGEVTIGPHCDAMYGHDARTVNVHVPLTAARGTSALVVERTVGAEDFAALEVGGCGAAFAFVGGVAAHFGAENHTTATRCSLDLRLRFFAAAGDAYEAPGYFAAATRRADGAWLRSTTEEHTAPIPIELEAELSESFMKYAMSTILGRALPDARDGLRHVRLVDGHGNFGSVDADPPAAMRYTECKLTKFAYEALLNGDDLGKANRGEPLAGGVSVNFSDNFDASEMEPDVLPARVPVLLVNGAAGIAVIKSELLAKTADAINARRIEGIADLRDESGREGTPLFELKRDAQAEIVLSNLFKSTRLQTSFPANIVAVDHALNDDGDDVRSPVRMTLRYALERWLSFRFDCAKLVEGGAIPAMGALSEDQASAVLALTLSRLTTLEADKLDSERKDLEVKLEGLRKLMSEDAAVYDAVVDEVAAIKKAYPTPRRSEIVFDGDAELRDEDVIENARSAVLVARDGYVKRTSLEEFGAQSRGGRGRNALQGGTLRHLVTCHDHDTLLCIADTGAPTASAFNVPQASRRARRARAVRAARGPVDAHQGLLAVAHDTLQNPKPGDDDELFLVLTLNGLVKKTPSRRSRASRRGA